MQLITITFLGESTERVRHIRNVSIVDKNVHVSQPHILN